MTQYQQDRSLLEGLELDRAATLIDFAKAERRYKKATMRGSVQVANDIIDHMLTNEPTYDVIQTRAGFKNSKLMHLEGNRFTRSSVSGPSGFDNVIIQTQVARHSRRTSIILDEDQK